MEMATRDSDWTLHTSGDSYIYLSLEGQIGILYGVAHFAYYERPEISDLQYINIDFNTYSTNFGNLSEEIVFIATCSSETRFVVSNGSKIGKDYDGFESSMFYVNSSSKSESMVYGNSTLERFGASGCSSSTRGLFGGGDTYAVPTVSTCVIDYITISSLGNANNFGNLYIKRKDLSACSSSTNGFFCGGMIPGYTKAIDCVTISTLGNASEFGSLSDAVIFTAASSSPTHGFIGGGKANINDNIVRISSIDRLSLSTYGEVSNFGNLTLSRCLFGACSSSTKCVFTGGSSSDEIHVIEPNDPPIYDTMDYINTASGGEASEFGGCISISAAQSNCHGGLA
jgi:hypothetical protein